ncbi:MAG TPA: RNA polymerase factor sigma-54, partial [Albitalea sp.]|nr:RNA polymerase factor sigma-54 [Albitalea sp.]
EEDTTPVFEPLSERISPAEHAGERESENAAEAASGTADETAGVDSAEFGGTEREDWENGTERDDFDGIRETPSGSASTGSDNDDFEPQDRNAVGQTLQEFLRDQLPGMRLSPEDAAALHILIESLDDDGYLADPLEDIAALLVEDEAQREELVERLQCALKWLQSMEPTGVGAKNLAECLTLQLRQQPRCEAQMIAIIVCKQHLDLLARRDMKKLMAATGADEALLKEAQALIVALEPKPARRFARAEANIIVPDVIVQKAGRSWKVVLNQDVMPKLRINDLYAQAIRQNRGANGSGAGLSSRLQEARWFMKNIQQRFDTIQRVSQAIVERQKSFFTHGEIAMKPLVLREIADELGLHESTISRVTTAKYMATPFGTFELKYFFGSSLNTEAGGNASSTAVRALIKQLVSAEDAAKPLSDSQLSQMLEEQGIQVARRTVAKYREALRIAPANLRKAM